MPPVQLPETPAETAPAAPQKTGEAAPPLATVKPLGQTVTLDLGQGVKMELAPIPAGKFIMGRPPEEQPKPPSPTDARRYRVQTPRPSGFNRPPRPPSDVQHQVTISRPFYMGVTTVTQEQYQAIMGDNPSMTKGAKHPVEQVTWDEAVQFCEKLSQKTGRKISLPTEAQWEYACRAGTTTRFNTGDTLTKDQANFDDSATAEKPGGDDVFKRKTVPVASYKANAWGLYDMHGNVQQWCADIYVPYSPEPAVDPIGPARPPPEYGDMKMRVIRGGAYWGFGSRLCESGRRNESIQDARNALTGFRICMVAD